MGWGVVAKKNDVSLRAGEPAKAVVNGYLLRVDRLVLSAEVAPLMR